MGFHLNLTSPTIFAIIHISAPLLLIHVASNLKFCLPTAPLPSPFSVPVTVPIHSMSEPNASESTTTWVRSRLAALYEDIQAGEAFDRAFSPACDVRANHAAQPLQTLKDELAARRGAATHVSVAWGGEDIATNEDKPEEVRYHGCGCTTTNAAADADYRSWTMLMRIVIQPAVIAGAFVVTRSLPFRIRAGPAQRQTHVHFSAK